MSSRPRFLAPPIVPHVSASRAERPASRKGPLNLISVRQTIAMVQAESGEVKLKGKGLEQPSRRTVGVAVGPLQEHGEACLVQHVAGVVAGSAVHAQPYVDSLVQPRAHLKQQQGEL